jgi:hypothetical protein
MFFLAREMIITWVICPSSPSSLLFRCFVFKFMSWTITVLLCLKILVISPIWPLSRPDMTFTVSPILTCILCNLGRLFGLHSTFSHRLYYERRNMKNITQDNFTIS